MTPFKTLAALALHTPVPTAVAPSAKREGVNQQDTSFHSWGTHLIEQLQESLLVHRYTRVLE
jgi:hypothetical protein